MRRGFVESDEQRRPMEDVGSVISHADRPAGSPGDTGGPSVSICLPVHDGAQRIGEALTAISRFDYDGDVRVFCVANGCTDDSADRARAFGGVFRRRGWELEIIEVDMASRPAALRYAESVAPPGLFAILDVNVGPAPDALRRMVEAIQTRELSVVSGRLCYVERGSAIVRRFALAYGRAPFARSDDLKGTFLLFAPHHRRVVKSMPDTGADDRYFTRSTSREERASIESATVDYFFPESLGALLRQQIRWKRNNLALDRMMVAGETAGHVNNRWPYLQPLPPLSATLTYFAVTAVATLVARIRPREVTAWRR